MKSVLALSLCAAMALCSLCGCSAEPVSSDPQENTTQEESVQFHQQDYGKIEEYVPADNDGAVHITLSGSTAQADGAGCSVRGSEVTIQSGGTYVLSGSLEGRVVVDASGEKVNLVLDGVSITSRESSPLYIRKGKQVTVTLAENSENILSDGEGFVYDDAENEEPNAALFSKADLVLTGKGSLTVNAVFNNGIQSKDTLEIHGGTYNITAANHGITGKDSLLITAGTFSVEAGGDGLRSTNTEPELGWVSIPGGSFRINAGQDGIQAETTLYIGTCELDITTGGGSVNSSSDNSDWGSWGQGNNFPGGWEGFGFGWDTSEASDSSSAASAKGIKAGSDVLIEDGVITIDSSDDALHSNGNLSVTGGEITVSSGDDGIHADATLVIAGGNILIRKSYEGIEGVKVFISGGRMDVTAYDDGINSAGGSDGQSDRPGANMFAVDENCDVTISGGEVVLDASGDGIDSNGHIFISGGLLAVNGPTNGGNGPLDYAGECSFSGGTAAISGSSQMAQGASSSSTQASMLLCFSSTLKGGTLVSLTDSSGNVVFALTPQKDFSSVLVSCPAFAVGESYKLWIGGTCIGEGNNGVYTGGTLQDAVEVTDVTMSEVNTCYGGGGGFGGGGPGGPGGHGGHGPGPGGR